MKETSFEKLTTRVIITNRAKFLIVRRSESDTRRPGLWELPGGWVDYGESLEKAAAREVQEETGIKLTDLKFIKSSQYTTENNENRMVAFFTATTSTSEVKLSNEHDSYSWESIDNIHNINISKYHLGVVNELLNNSSNHKEAVDLNTTKTSNVIVYTDGGSRGNPGPSATGYVIMDEQRKILIEGGEYLGITTNNQAEYLAVKKALEICKNEIKPNSVEFYIDSLLVVNQMNGKFKVKNRDLWPIYENIKSLTREFSSVTFTHVKREKNKLADAKVNEVLDAQ